jgi:hypothetical protein
VLELVTRESQQAVTAERLAIIRRGARVELIKRAARRKDVLTWGKLLFPDKFKLPFCQALHGDIVADRGAELTNKEAPRNHAKTAIQCFLVPIFQALEEATTFRHYLNVQATNAKALAVNTAIRVEIEENEDLRYVYGDQVSDHRWSDQQFVLKSGVVFSAVSAGQSIRGINYRNLRPDYVIVDDLYDEEDIHNPESTTKKNAWFWGSLFPARSKGVRHSVHVQGTAINKYDLLEELKTKDRWKSASFSACDEEKRTVLWPELNTFEQIMADKRDMPATIFARELQNRRLDDSSSIVKSEWLSAWEYDPADLKFDADLRLTAVVLAIDPSIGKKAESDPAGYALVLKAQRSDGSKPIYYIEALENKCMSLQERLDRAKEYVTGRPSDRRVTEVRVEAISGFDDFAEIVARHLSVGVTKIAHVPDKITHLERKSHYFQNRRVFLNRNVDPEKKRALFDQLTTNKPLHDDVRDAVLHALDDESDDWRSWL